MKKKPTFLTTISLFLITVVWFLFSIFDGRVAITYIFYLFATSSFVVTILEMRQIASSLSTVKIKIKLFALAIAVLMLADLIVTSILVLDGSSRHIATLSLMEENLVGKEINTSIDITYSEDSREIFQKHNELKESGTLLKYNVIGKASRNLNIYLVKDKKIERALLYSSDSKHNIVIIHPETKRNSNAEVRTRRVLGGQERYIGERRNETVFWDFIEVSKNRAYKFSSTNQGSTVDSYGWQRNAFYSDFIEYFEDTRLEIVKPEIWKDKHYPTYLLSLLR